MSIVVVCMMGSEGLIHILVFLVEDYVLILDLRKGYTLHEG